MLAIAVNGCRILYCIKCSKLKSNTSEDEENILSVIKTRLIVQKGAQQLSSNYFKFQHTGTMLGSKSTYLCAGKVCIPALCLYDSSSKHMLFIFPN